LDHIWQWIWDRHGARYEWAIWAVMFASMFVTYLLWSYAVVALEKSTGLAEANAFVGVGLM
jgi:hypothetical protein